MVKDYSKFYVRLTDVKLNSLALRERWHALA